MLKNRKISYKVYLILLAVVMLFSLFFAGIFSYEDTNIFNIPDKLTELAGHFWQFNRYFNAIHNSVSRLGISCLDFFMLCNNGQNA